MTSDFRYKGGDPYFVYDLMEREKLIELKCRDINGNIVKWRWIRGSQTRNYDGTAAPNPDRSWVLEKRILYRGKTRYTNFWGFLPKSPVDTRTKKLFVDLEED